MNRLISEKSPYLQQHAKNPVDWYPWCEVAFKRAKEENKLIFLSIGYSTCHWCHIMADECFEDEEVAKLLNENFISIKVDREERKDIDNIYMLTCNILTNQGGWPLNLFLTPDKKPFFAGTYIPKNSLIKLINQINNLWKTKREVIINEAEKVVNILKEILNRDNSQKIGIDEQLFYLCFEMLYNEFDSQNGGFGKYPKFPIAHNIKFLLNYYEKFRNQKSLLMALKTLESIRLRGIYDHIGGGIHRYSTDEKWLIPHFEKTLYDQALISESFLYAYKISDDKFYLQSAIDILNYVKINLLSENFGFYSGEDALIDYYLWEYEEIEKILKDDIKVLLNFQKDGNFLDEKTREKTGKNVIAIKDRDGLKIFNKYRKELAMLREKRNKPEIDKKILTDWNSLISTSILLAYKLTSNNEYLKIAEKNLNFLSNTMYNQNKIYHRLIEEDVSIDGFIDDYIFLIEALLLLYEIGNEKNIFENVLNLMELTLEYFWDNENGGFYYTSSFSETVLVRKKEFVDSIVPSANSRAFYIFQKLYEITNDNKFIELKNKLKDSFSKEINSHPVYFTEFLSYCLSYYS